MSRISIRRRPRNTRSLTAAAQRVTDPQKAFKKSTLSVGGDDWQDQAWKYLELVGELAYYASWRSSSASRVRFVASEIGDDGEPTGTVAEDNMEGQRVRQIVNSIAGGVAGQSQLLKRHVYLLTIPGECWAAMIVRDPTRETNPDGTPTSAAPTASLGPTAQLEQWYAFNREEITSKGQDVILSLPDGTKHTFNPDIDLLFRVWEPHPKNASLPVSPVWANRTVLNEIVKATATIDNAAKSRLVGNGLMFIPQEMSLPNQVAPTAVPVGSDPATGGQDPDHEPTTSQQMQDLIYDVASTAIKDPDSLAALLPIIAAAPGESIKNIQWLRPASDIPETALKTRTEAIRRLAMGLDVAPERLLGMGANSNHWSAWAIDESDVRIHIAPPVETVCNAYTQEVLRPKLIEEGIDPNKYVIWHDDTRLTEDPDKQDEAQAAHDRGALSSGALRKYLGFADTDGYDLTSKEGWLELAMDKAAKDPNLIPLLAPLLGAMVDGVTAPAIEAPTPPTPEPQPAPAPGQEPDTENNPPEEGGLNAAAYGFTRLCVNRALEMANKRQRTRTNHAAFQGVPITEAHHRLPPVPVNDVEPLVRGWDTCVDEQTCAAFGFDATMFRGMVNQTAARSLSTSAPWRFELDMMRAARLR